MKTIVITGANRGIGLALCAHYRAAGHTVYALCRTASQKLRSLDITVIEGIDVSANDIEAQLKEHFANITIDILINNAGILRNETMTDFNLDTIREQFEVNSLGPMRVSLALQNNIADSGKIAMITSRMGSVADNTSGSRYGYRMSKAALNIAAMSLTRDLSHRGIAVAIVHPGYVQTDMVNGNGDVSAEQSAANIIARIDQTNADNSGTFWHAAGQVLPW